jgi:hypothetical protein
LTTASGLVRNGTLQCEAFQLPLAEPLQHCGYVELRMNGVAGEGVVKLEAKLRVNGDRWTDMAERDSRRSVLLKGFPHVRPGFCGHVIAHRDSNMKSCVGSSAVGWPID